MAFTVRNHYVPQWYQHRFFTAGAGQTKLQYLDLKPDLIDIGNGRRKPRTALRLLGPINCFRQDHLYTLFFDKDVSDVIERRFFGEIDRTGERAVAFFQNYSYCAEAHEAFPAMRAYLAAQLFRTPKGLRLLQRLAGTTSHQHTLIALEELWQLYVTIWSEAVWEVFHCKGSKTKFIISDSPVTTYNPQVFPMSSEMLQYGIARIERTGTRILFPMDQDHCLCLTHLQRVRSPQMDPLKLRENPRYFGQGLFDLRAIQRGREIEEGEVIAINHILKRNALRYIAAEREEWLYPERHLKSLFWSKLGDRYFLGPDPRKASFTTSIVAGGGSAGTYGMDEYGHSSLDHPRARKLRSAEWITFQGAKQSWDERDRRAGRDPPADLHEYW